jgi:hypothetical protein
MRQFENNIKLLKMKSTLIILGCVAYSALAVSTSIKEKLGQAKKNALAEQACTCTLSGAVGAGNGLPSLGQGVYAGSSQSAEVSEGQAVMSVPDTQYSEVCQQAVCECNSQTQAAVLSATRTRVYTVNGTVDAAESDIFAAQGTAQQASSGSKRHQAASVLNNVGSTASGASQACVQLCTASA